MRQIKFRGRDLKTGDWRYGYVYQIELESGLATMILTTDNNHADHSIEPKYHLAFTLWVDLFPVDPETVGQSTGIEDKNGREIYEGDIIKTNQYGMVWVAWNKERCQFELRNFDHGFLATLWDSYSGIYEVVGNVCLKPELQNKAAD